MAQIIKAGTKRAENLLARTRYNEGRTLDEVYGSYSSAKASAYRDCMRWYLESENHDNFRIISHNSFSFSVAWEMDYVDPETGEVHDATRIETSSNTYIVLHDAEVE